MKSESKKTPSCRAERNRVAARTCRARKQVYMAGLELKVAELSGLLREIGYAGESTQSLEKFVLKSAVGEDILAFFDSSFRAALLHGSSSLPSADFTPEQQHFFLSACQSVQLHSLALDAAVADFRRALDSIAAVAGHCRRDLEHFFDFLDEDRISIIHNNISRFHSNTTTTTTPDYFSD